MTLVFIHVVVDVNNHSLLFWSSSILHEYTMTYLSICLFSTFGLFQVWAIMNDAVINIYSQVLVWKCILWVNRMELLGHVVHI